MKIKAKATKHYAVAGRLLKGQVVEVDEDMGRRLLAMHDELEEVEDKPKRGKEVLTEKNVDLKGLAEKAEKEERVDG